MNPDFRRRLVSFALVAGKGRASASARPLSTSAVRFTLGPLSAASPPSTLTTSKGLARSIIPRSPSTSPWSISTRSATTLLRKPEEPEEPEVFRDGEPTIIATDRAIKQLKRVAERENNHDLALRVAVEPGGCHGYQYKMELTEEVEDDDFQFEVDPGVRILVDSISLALVRGSTIDYVTELIGSQFAIKNNPQAKGAGCGCGVSWEPNL